MRENGRTKPVELLAPAGGMAALEAVLRAGADAVYLSGKRFGMRGHRSSFHFDEYSMKHAIRRVHDAGARIYVTVNNLLSDDEVKDALAYIAFLREYGADAVILQDLGLLKWLKDDPPGLDIHVSTMMNVHSSPFAGFLKSLGVSRIITSRDISLSQVSEMAHRTGLEMEYFVHGDMCSVQSGLCLTSGILFGQSSNRGRCLKPCRWPWRIVPEHGEPSSGTPMKYHLARKDMCLLHALPKVVESGIASLKIEGRMRPAGYLEKIVGVYRRALDRYFADPFLYEEDAEDAGMLNRERTRDFTACHAFGRPGPRSIDPSGGREPRFFSTPVETPELHAAEVNPDPISGPLPSNPPSVVAAVYDTEQLDAVLPEGPDWIYLVSHLKAGKRTFTLPALSRAVAICQARGVRCAIVLSPVTPDCELDHLPAFVNKIIPNPDAWMAGNAGQLPLLGEALAGSDSVVMADGSIHAFNRAALELLAERGVTRISLSAELSLGHLASMGHPYPLEIEVAVHGPVQAMFTEDCLLRLAMDKDFDAGSCRRFCDRNSFALENEIGERFPILPTRSCRGAVFFPRHLCLLHKLGKVLEAKAASLRLNLFGYDPREAARTLRIYKKTLERIFDHDPDWFRRADLEDLDRISKEGLWEGASGHGVVPEPASSIREKESS